MTPAVRVARKDEAAAIAELVVLAFRAEDFFINGNRTDEADIRGLLAKDQFLVMEGDQGGLLAAVHLAVDGPRCYFGMLSVQPSLQGTGIGRAMVDAAEAYAREHGCADMDISVVNLRAELFPWYEKLGYRRCGVLPFPYPERLSRPAHLVRMTRPLTGGA